MKVPPKIYIPILVGSLTANIFLLYYYINPENETLKMQTMFPLLSKKVITQNPNDVLINFLPLRKALKEYSLPYGNNLGIYFEYLPSGTSIGVNEKDEVKLASLSKIPLAMSILKKVSLGQVSLSDAIILKQENLDDKYGDLWKRGAGTKLTVEELIKHALQESDNTAYQALFDTLTKEEVNGVYDNLDIEVNRELENGQSYPIVSPQGYSSIFRSLYLASYLSQKDSSYILDILTKTIFKNTIEAPIPKTIPVAHKIGVFEEKNNGVNNIFIDCGIVYYPQRPYILCIFVKNYDEKTADEQIAYISKMIYGYINAVAVGK